MAAKYNGTKTAKEDKKTASENMMLATNFANSPLEIPPDHHKLQHQYWFWFSRRFSGNNTKYDTNLKFLARFGSVEQFWGIYNHMKRPCVMEPHCEYHLFKVGIKPMWEDESNVGGGKWMLRLRKGLVSRCWENLILAMIGEQFMVGDEICGAVVSSRFQEDIISIWNKTSNDQGIVNRIRDTLRRVLNLPPNTILEYKTHNESIKLFANIYKHK